MWFEDTTSPIKEYRKYIKEELKKAEPNPFDVDIQRISFLGTALKVAENLSWKTKEEIILWLEDELNNQWLTNDTQRNIVLAMLKSRSEMPQFSRWWNVN